MLANPEFVKATERERKNMARDCNFDEDYAGFNQKRHAEICYQFADAMIIAREKDTPI